MRTITQIAVSDYAPRARRCSASTRSHMPWWPRCARRGNEIVLALDLAVAIAACVAYLSI